jgi:hypothetical protein
MKLIVLSLVTAGLALTIAQSASATILFDNGTSYGGVGGYEISSPYSITNAFALAQNSSVTGIQFEVYNVPGDVTTNIDWSITSQAVGGTSYAAGLGTSVSSMYQLTDGFPYDVDEDNFSTGPVDLSAGTYFLTLGNAVEAEGQQRADGVTKPNV